MCLCSSRYPKNSLDRRESKRLICKAVVKKAKNTCEFKNVFASKK